jgi:RimJ/RimL family protein N-acetyltransferase
VVVRALCEADVDRYVAAFDEGESLLNLLGWEQPPAAADVERWFAENWVEPPQLRAWELAIADARDDSFLGAVMFHSVHWRHRRAEVGFWVTREERGRGVGTAAIRLVLRWAFEDLGLERMEMTALPENEAVPRLADRLGFAFEGVQRRRNFERGRRVDILTWGLLRDESDAR